MKKKISKTLEKQLVKIAQQTIPELETREDLDQHMSDELDFIDGIAVWNIRDALIKAYELGRTAQAAEVEQPPQPTLNAEEKAKLEKRLFKTLKHYSHGYHSNATEEENKIYDAKVAALKARIIADADHAPEIIAEEFAANKAAEYRAHMTGSNATVVRGAEWKAIDNVYMSLIDSKPYKA